MDEIKNENVIEEQNPLEQTSIEETSVQTAENTHNPLNIAEEDIWTYKIDGLSAPHINKPYKFKLLKQIVFVVVIVVAIALAIYFSVQAVQKETFDYKEKEIGYQLSKFSNTGYVTVMSVDYVSELKYTEGNPDPNTNFYFVKDEGKPVTSIREYAFNCDEKLKVIYIGASVTEIDGKSFYSCNALERIEVAEDNPAYCDVDGVLYNKEMTEVICFPIKHSTYVANKLGYDSDADKQSESYVNDVLTYKIPSTVTKIGKLCFNYTDLVNVYLPEGLKSIETLGFFRATALKNVYSYKTDGMVYNSLPEGLEYLGSDAFSYNQSMDYIYIPASVTHIGHHAFWDTVYKEGGEIKGITEINVAVSKQEFKKGVKAGDQWKPKYDYLLFKKAVKVNYDATRKS
ncbi:MAG: leucine-rich repeat domain-containing protein [Clostridia bacterium]|nr:leucine-rich repeat domain-containing protein [Clostridia bacterium]